MAKEPGSGGGGGSVDVGGGEPLPYLAPDDSQEFVQMADLFIVLPQEGSQGLQERLPLHSQVLSRSCAAVAQMLASLADERSGAACSPAHPLDISTFFAGCSRPATLLFLACAYNPDAAPARLQAALEGNSGGLPALTGMLALAHRLDASRLLNAALDWAHERRDEVYSQHPTLWLSTAAALQLDLLRGRLAAWAVSRLQEGPAAAATLLQRLDFAVLPPDTAAMLLDGLAAAAVAPPSSAAYAGWDGPGSLCQRVAALETEAAAAEAAEAAAAQAGEGLDALFEAQQEQAAEDWDAGWDEAEEAELDLEGDDGDWDDGLPAHLFDAAHPVEGPFEGLLPELLEGVQLEEGEGQQAAAAAADWPDEFEAWEQQAAAAQEAPGDAGGWGEEFEAWEQQQEQQAAGQEAAGAADEAPAWEQQLAGDGGGDAGGGAAAPAVGNGNAAT